MESELYDGPVITILTLDADDQLAKHPEPLQTNPLELVCIVSNRGDRFGLDYSRDPVGAVWARSHPVLCLGPYARFPYSASRCTQELY